MLCAYYDKSCNSRKLFEGLKISEDSHFGEHLNRYNVIYVKDLWNEAASRMSRLAGAIRSCDGLEEAAEKTIEAWKKLKNSVTVKDAGELWMVFRLRDGLICQYVYLQAMKDYMDYGGKSRGSALYTDIPEEKIDFSTFCGFICEEEKDPLIQEIALEGAKTVCCWRPVRPIPKDDDFFENVWRGYRENKNVY